jgi:hypothetical protein
MGIGQVAHRDVVADAGAIGGEGRIAVDLETGSATSHRADHQNPDAWTTPTVQTVSHSAPTFNGRIAASEAGIKTQEVGEPSAGYLVDTLILPNSEKAES